MREDGPLCGKTVGDVLVELGFGVVEHRPKAGTETLFPGPSTRLIDGDAILVQGPFDKMAELRNQGHLATPR